MCEVGLVIYNSYLRALGDANGRPSKGRKSLDSLKNDDKVYLDKLVKFFTAYKHIDKYLFFKSSFVKTELKYIDLKYFTTMKAVGNFKKFMNDNNGDVNELIIDSFKLGIKRIVEFCKKNAIQLKDYKNCTNENGIKWFLIHLNEQKITMYNIHLMRVDLSYFPEEYSNLYIFDYEEKYALTKQRYTENSKMREIALKFEKFFM